MRFPRHLLGHVIVAAWVWATLSVPLAGAPEAATFRTSVGPWGRLQCYYFYLEAPDNLVADVPIPDTQTRWCVPEAEQAQFQKVVAATSLGKEAVTALFDPHSAIIRNGTANLFPSTPLIEAMTSRDRALIAAQLARYPNNEFQQYPVFFLSGSAQAWAKNAGLPEDAVTRIESLSYMRGNLRVFSDLPVLFDHAKSDTEARLLQKKFTRVRTLIARLEIDDSTNTSELTDYWSTGMNLRRKEVEPLLLATVSLPGVQYLDIVHLLPALPRKLLYTYPSDDVTSNIRLPDCHWTTLNFFNYKAQDYYLDSRLAASAILENFNTVDEPYRYGDVLMFVDADGNAFHSCIYLAGDIVYTKNGRNPLQPWMLIELADLKNMYLINAGTRIQGFRHKLAKAAAKGEQ